MIEVDGLRKEYGEFVAVEGSSFSVDRGEVFGVVGPNGAGKTTTLKMLAGLIEPTAGAAVIDGRPAGSPAMQRDLGFLPEESPLYEEMTAAGYLDFFADLYEVPVDVASERIEAALDRLELDHRERRIGNMSKGMKRKVAIARALVNDPSVLIFDEPASGLDPLTTNEVIEFTSELADEGKTVVFSAHNLFHVESVCDRVAIMTDGRIVARGSLDEIRDEHGGTEYRVEATVEVSLEESTDARAGATDAGAGAADCEGGATGTRAGEADAKADATGARAGSAVDGREATREGGAVVETTRREDGTVRYAVEDVAAVERVQEAVDAAGGTVTDIQTHTPSLEEIFLEVAAGPSP